MTNGLPKEIARLIQAVKSIPGVTDAAMDKTYLPDIGVSDLSLPGFYGDLPAATLRRTNGALPDELLLSIDFLISREETGLKALEFLAWWTRDCARSGDNMQMRVIGLPPMTGQTKQLGQTLRFTIDWFYTNPSQDLGLVLTAIDEAGASLEQAVSLYEAAFH